MELKPYLPLLVIHILRLKFMGQKATDLQIILKYKDTVKKKKQPRWKNAGIASGKLAMEGR